MHVHHTDNGTFVGSFVSGFTPATCPSLTEQRNKHPQRVFDHLVERTEFLLNEGDLDGALEAEQQLRQMFNI